MSSTDREYKNQLKTTLNKISMGESSLTWKEEMIAEQSEVECGPRTIWAMAVVLLGWKLKKSMEDIQLAIYDLEENNVKLNSLQVRQST